MELSTCSKNVVCGKIRSSSSVVTMAAIPMIMAVTTIHYGVPSSPTGKVESGFRPSCRVGSCQNECVEPSLQGLAQSGTSIQQCVVLPEWISKIMLQQRLGSQRLME